MLAIFGGTPVKTTKPPVWPQITDADRAAVASAACGDLHGGERRAAFERRFAADCGTAHCFAVANGTVSLELILRGFGIGLGDEVILPPYTFVATLSSIVFTGATPVFADIDRGTYNISPTAVEAKITERTKAIVAVAVGGCPPDLDALEEIAHRRGVRLIVDAAQAVGAEWRGRSICSYGDAASVSCQNTKNLTCGEGGIITTNDTALAERLSLMLGGGTRDGKYVSVAQEHGITEMQAALLSSQYEKLPREILLREKNAAYLSGRLRELPFVSGMDYDDRITCHAYHLYLMRFDRDALKEKGITKKQILKAVSAEGVPLSGGYAPLYSFPCISARDTERMIGGRRIDSTPLPECERASYEEGAWLYQALLLETREGMDAIADALLKVWEHADDVRRI